MQYIAAEKLHANVTHGRFVPKISLLRQMLSLSSVLRRYFITKIGCTRNIEKEHRRNDFEKPFSRRPAYNSEQFFILSRRNFVHSI